MTSLSPADRAAIAVEYETMNDRDREMVESLGLLNPPASMFQVMRASAHAIPLPDESVHLIVTSPPYANLRSYAGEQAIEWPTVTYSPMVGLPAITIQGCEPDCMHVWGFLPTHAVKITNGQNALGLSGGRNSWGDRNKDAGHAAYCQLCDGWRGGLGQEPDVSAYIGHLILCLRNWKKLLRSDGTCWVNLGDSMSGSGGSGGDYGPGGLKEGQPKTKGAKANGIPAKNLLLVPERFRLAAQADGWIVRSQFPWVKKSSLPESVLDRPSNSAESWVMLAKSQKYYWDAEAIKAEAAGPGKPCGRKNDDSRNDGDRTGIVRGDGVSRNRRTGDWLFESLDAAIADTRRWIDHAEHVKANQGLLLDTDGDPLAMLVNPRPFPGQHFACFPPGVVEPLILAGSSQRGCCPKCGNPWRRVVEREVSKQGDTYNAINDTEQPRGIRHGLGASTIRSEVSTTTTGWEPSCTCNAGEPVPATVLDPFVGSGTTLEVATSLGRHSIGVDISQEYLDNVLPTRFTDGVQIGMQF